MVEGVLSRFEAKLQKDYHLAPNIFLGKASKFKVGEVPLQAG